MSKYIYVHTYTHVYGVEMVTIPPDLWDPGRRCRPEGVWGVVVLQNTFYNVLH